MIKNILRLAFLVFAMVSIGAPAQQTIDINNTKFSQGYGINIVDQPANLSAKDFYLGTDASKNISHLPSRPSKETWKTFLEKTPEKGRSLSVTPSLQNLMKFNHDSLMMGGNITGGGEGTYYMDLDLSAPSSPENMKDLCQVKGFLLADLGESEQRVKETFEFSKTSPYLKEPSSLTEDDLFYGAPIDMNVSAVKTMAQLNEKLKKWQKSSPLFVQLIQDKLKSTPFYVTNFALLNPDTENGIISFLLSNFQKQAVACLEKDYWLQPTHMMAHETLASFEPHRGVIISNHAWALTGDLSRQGLIVHELLRSFQYQDQFPLAHGQVRRLVRDFILGQPENFEEMHLDRLLMTHTKLSATNAYIFDERRLRLACGQKTEQEYWIDFENGDIEKLFSRAATLMFVFPKAEEIEGLHSLDSSYSKDFPLNIRLQTAVVFSQLLKNFDSKNLAKLIESPHHPLWFELVDLKVLTRENYYKFLKRFLLLYDKVCSNPSFSQGILEGFPDLSGQVELYDDLKIASEEQIDYLHHFDLLLRLLKVYDPMLSEKNFNKTMYPNIYLPAADHSADYFFYLLDLAMQQDLSNPGALQFMVELSRLPDMKDKKQYFIDLNKRFVDEFWKAAYPPVEFRNQAFPYIDN